MADKTGIEWTDSTWNPVRGCTRVSQGCVNCYAETMAARFSDPGQAYAGLATRNPSRWTGEVRVVEKALDQPLRWKRPRRIFVNSMSDLFHEKLSNIDIDRIFAVMALAGQHTFQILTKRPQRMRDYIARTGRSIELLEQQARALGWSLKFEGAGMVPWPLPNVWLGTSVENQETADERIPLLLQTKAAVHFLSCEPLLGPVQLHSAPVDWVIVGGESGKGARMMQEDWALSLMHQCRETGTAFFMKQMTFKAPIPPAMLVREFPKGWSQ